MENRKTYGMKDPEGQEKRLTGKIALITGAGSGIGRAIAERFAREGARIGINYCHNREGAAETLRRVEAAGSEGLLLKADVAREAEVASMIEHLLDHFGAIDILVNNSGIGTSRSPDRVAEILAEDWDRVLAVNLKAVMLTSKHALPRMIRQNQGSIINISSIRGLLGNPTLASYCASKGGVVLLSKQMALDYANNGIRVNAICPGFVLTEMLEGYINKQENPQAARASFAAMSALGRIGRPEEIAAVAVFFASDASSFVTGVALPVDGGYTAYGMRDIL
ncbi:MAG: glucose 1-dehydrogenase [Spirochaetaceae bacterium]|nr:MAG: glucose 1-dehydrogenase [Spirochaetaceae bacterium]